MLVIVPLPLTKTGKKRQQKRNLLKFVTNYDKAASNLQLVCVSRFVAKAFLSLDYNYGATTKFCTLYSMQELGEREGEGEREREREREILEEKNKKKTLLSP